MFENIPAGQAHRSAESQLYKHWWQVHRYGEAHTGSNFLPAEVRRPKSPASCDLAKSITTAHALRVLKDSSADYLFNFAGFLAQVKSYGPMDFVHDKDAKGSQRITHVDFGNYTYEKIGMALGLATETSLNSSGVTAKHLRAGDRNDSLYGDQPRDSFFVQVGVYDDEESHKIE